MDMTRYYTGAHEQPLDRIVDDGGFTSIFRTIACIGDSLSSGEFESNDEHDASRRGYHDYYDYSWGQYIARAAGVTVYNFSRGGLTARAYYNDYSITNDCWNPDKLAQAYILALGVNDVINQGMPVGTLADVDFENYENCKPTFLGEYAKIILRLKSMQPQARFFLVTMPRYGEEKRDALAARHAEVLHELAAALDYTYVIDLFRYAPVYDADFKARFFLGGHMNAMGYILTAKMIMSYIDYIIRHDPASFKQVPFIGTSLRHWAEPY